MVNSYYPFGLQFNSYQRVTAKRNDYLYNGKELQDELDLNWLHYGARMYDPAIGKWGVVDPLSERRIDNTPYQYVLNNPILRVDPDGLTDFKYDKEAGEVTKVEDTKDATDRIVKTDKDGNVKRKGEGFLGFLVKEENVGKAKTAIGGIEEGILEDGQNFKTKDNVFAVGKEGQPSVKGVEEFALKLAQYVGKEIGGAYFAGADGIDVDMSTHITFGQYQYNSSHESKANGDVKGYSKGLNKTGHFHTHQANGDRTIPSGADITSKNRNLKSNG